MTDMTPGSEEELTELISSIDAQAPPGLHARIQAMADEASARRSPASRHALTLRIGLGSAALAAVVIALVLVLGGSGSPAGGLDVNRTAAVALARPTLPAPGESPSSRAELEASVENVAFPYWGERFGWESSGSRIDHVAGRTVKTVFYTDAAGRRVGYAIVAGSPAPSAGAGTVRWLHGTPYHLTKIGGSDVVSWVRDGHLCVVAGRGVAPATLLALASWQEPSSAA